MKVNYDNSIKEKIAITLWKFIRTNDYSVKDDNFVPLALYLTKRCHCKVGDKYVEYLMSDIIPNLLPEITFLNPTSEITLINNLRVLLSYKRKPDQERRINTVGKNFQAVIDILSNPENNVSEKDIINVLENYSYYKNMRNKEAYSYINKFWSNDMAIKFIALTDRKIKFRKSIEEIIDNTLNDKTPDKLDITETFIKLIKLNKSLLNRTIDENFNYELYLSYFCHFPVNINFTTHLLYESYKHGLISISRENYYGQKHYEIINYGNIDKKDINILKTNLVNNYEGEYIEKNKYRVYRYKIFSFLYDMKLNYIPENINDKFPSIIHNNFLYDKKTTLEEIQTFFYDKLGSYALSNKIKYFIKDMRILYDIEQYVEVNSKEVISSMKRKNEIMRELRREYIENNKELIEELVKIDSIYYPFFESIIASLLLEKGIDYTIQNWNNRWTFGDSYLYDNAFSFMITSCINVSLKYEENDTIEKYLLSLGFNKYENEYENKSYKYPCLKNLYIRGDIEYETFYVNVILALMKYGIKIVNTNLRDESIKIDCSLEEYKSIMNDKNFSIVEYRHQKGFCYIEN